MKHSQPQASHVVKRWIAAILGGQGTQWPSELTASIEAVCDQAATEGVAALLYSELCDGRSQIVVPAALKQRLSGPHARAAAIEIMRQAETERVVSALQLAGIPVLVLKGAALARWAYREPHHRSRDDLDLLFSDEAMVSASETVLATLGYVVESILVNGTNYERTLHFQTPHGLTWYIDVHWRMSNHPVFANRFDYRELDLCAVTYPGPPPIRGLGRVHAFFNAAIHRISNILMGSGERLIWLYDFHSIGRHLTPEDWVEIVELAERRQLAGPCASAMHLCAEWFKTQWPADALKRMDELAQTEPFNVERGHLRWYFEWQTLGSLPYSDKFRFAFRKLLPEREYMYQRYQLTGDRQLPRAYLRRWAVGLSALWRGVRDRKRSTRQQ